MILYPMFMTINANWIELVAYDLNLNKIGFQDS